MRPAHILSKVLLTVGITFGLIFAHSSAALVTVDATTAFVGPISIGTTFDVDISATWDGAGALTGVFSSHVWDNSQIMLTNVVFPLAPTTFTSRPIIFDGGSYYIGLERLGTIAAGVAGDDLTSSARTVQYVSSGPALFPFQAKTDLVTRLTFQVVGVGDGIINIDGAFLTGDVGAVGDSFAFGSNVLIEIIPEPSTALLIGLGLAVLITKRSQRSDPVMRSS